MGPAWRPGGLELTQEMVSHAGLGEMDRVLDVACGLGETVRLLRPRSRLSIVGVDLGLDTLRRARERQDVALPACPPAFAAGDAEALPFAAGSFDAALCECALYTFLDKASALAEIARVLRPGGRLLLADVTLAPVDLPDGLQGVWAQVACVAEARPADEYASLILDAGFAIEKRMDCRAETLDFLRSIDQRLLAARIAEAVGKLNLAGVDIRGARRLLQEVMGLVHAGHLSYGYFIARR